MYVCLYNSLYVHLNARCHLSAKSDILQAHLVHIKEFKIVDNVSLNFVHCYAGPGLLSNQGGMYAGRHGGYKQNTDVQLKKLNENAQ
jgi:hypothetical protein